MSDERAAAANPQDTLPKEQLAATGGQHLPNEKSEVDLVATLANEYLDRYRRGEQPSVAEYADRHPELADQIHEVFPMMLLMEDHAPSTDEDDGGSELATGNLKLERIGEFRILREVGRGGMGVVYEAVQESLGRHVALKVLPTHSQLSPRRRERFKRESRAAARLHHTNIVPVFTVGDEGGMFYYAMQLIRGAGLDQVIDELNWLHPVRGRTPAQPASSRGFTAASRVAQTLWCESASQTEPPGALASGESCENLPCASDRSVRSSVHSQAQSSDSALSETGNQYWTSVARIGIQVAEALDYAHRQGILHRDIKPSNLLLDHNATVWVMDFGLAKSLKQNDLTSTGELIGTLRYMPPEQFLGKADARSDIYSLGLTMYELLTLRPAFDMPDRDRLIRAITFEEPPRPRKLDPQIPRDLETILLKAMDREPDRRYQRARELAADLTRFLNNEPVQARPISATERIAKWARRRPAIAALSVSLLLASILGFAGVTWQWRRAAAAYSTTAQALERESEAHAQTKAAQRAAETAKGAARRQAILAEKIAVFLAAQFKGTDMIGMGTYLDDADPDFDGNQTPLEILDRAAERVNTELESAPVIQARLMDTLGVVYFGRGFPGKAGALFERSLKLRREAPVVDRELLARSELNLACVRFFYGYYDEAETLLTDSLKIRRELLGHDHPHTRLTRFVLSWLRLDRDESSEALEEFERLVREVTQLRKSRFGPANRDLAFGLGYAAMHHHRKQDFARARTLLFEAAGLLPKEGFASDYFIHSGTALYKIHMNQPESIPELCQQISQKLKVDFGSEAFVGLIFAELGKGARAINRPVIAELLFQQAVVDSRKSLGHCPRTARIVASYGEILLQRGALNEGEPMLREAQLIFRETLGEQHQETVAVADRLGELPGQAQEAVATSSHAVETAIGEEESVLLTGHTDYLAAPHIPFDQYDAFTIELWVKNWQGFLVYQGGPDETGVQFTTSQGSMYSGEVSGGFRYTKLYRFSFGTPPRDRWHHLALVFDGQHLWAYSNGQCGANGSLEARRPRPLNRARHFWIGRHPQPHRKSSGLIRTLRVSNIARYENDFTPPNELPSDEHTVLLFDFTRPEGQLQGSVIPDLSAHANDGVVQNAWWLK